VTGSQWHKTTSAAAGKSPTLRAARERGSERGRGCGANTAADAADTGGREDESGEREGRKGADAADSGAIYLGSSLC